MNFFLEVPLPTKENTLMKVAINITHGGFSLSRKQLIRLCELQGKQIYFFYKEVRNESESRNNSLFRLVTLEELEALELKFKSYDRKKVTVTYYIDVEMYDSPIYGEGEYISPHEFGSSNEERTNPLLIQIIEEMPEENKDLRIVEVPDDVKWYISEYDGAEWVSEEHRTWR